MINCCLGSGILKYVIVMGECIFDNWHYLLWNFEKISAIHFGKPKTSNPLLNCLL
jgi:hypothetical protein